MPLFLQNIHTVINRSIGVSGKPVDARSWVYENFAYRPYASVSEVLTTLTTADQRKGNFSVFVKESGVTKEYWWKDGLTDGDLVEKTAGTTGGGGTTIIDLDL